MLVIGCKMLDASSILFSRIKMQKICGKVKVVLRVPELKSALEGLEEKMIAQRID